MVGLKNGHILRNFTKNGDPRDIPRNAEEEEEEEVYIQSMLFHSVFVAQDGSSPRTSKDQVAGAKGNKGTQEKRVKKPKYKVRCVCR